MGFGRVSSYILSISVGVSVLEAFKRFWTKNHPKKWCFGWFCCVLLFKLAHTISHVLPSLVPKTGFWVLSALLSALSADPRCGFLDPGHLDHFASAGELMNAYRSVRSVTGVGHMKNITPAPESNSLKRKHICTPGAYSTSVFRTKVWTYRSDWTCKIDSLEHLNRSCPDSSIGAPGP